MDFSKPGANKRVCAFFIDSFIAQTCGVVFVILFKINVAAILWIIWVLFKDCFNGQSPGKYLVGIQVVDENNSPASPSKTIIRNIFMVIPFFPVIEYIIMLRDKDEGKRIGDKAAKTKVHDLKPGLKDSIFLWVSIALAILVLVVHLGVAGLFFMYYKNHPELLQKTQATRQL